MPMNDVINGLQPFVEFGWIQDCGRYVGDFICGTSCGSNRLAVGLA